MFAADGRSWRYRLRDLLQLGFNHPLLVTLALLVAVSLVFLAAPGIDTAISAVFYDLTIGFSERRSPVYAFIREAGRIATWVLGLALAAPLLIKVLAPDSRLLTAPRISLFGLGALAIGPGLVVNGILKEFWGRARPRELVEFGGDGAFSSVWVISDQCERNCSFVSGEASSAFWLVALAFVVPASWRTGTLVVTLPLAAAVSYTRLAVGAHFLSDILIAWLLTLLVLIAMQKLVLGGLPPDFDDNVEVATARRGRVIRRWWAEGRRRQA